jgi:anti-anti-sigma factor
MAGARLLIQPVRDVAVVNFSDASILDTLQVQQIGEELYDLVENRARRKVILDFGNVRFLSSSALGVLINLRKKADSIKGKVMLCCIRPEILRVFKLTSLDKLFEIHESEEKALNAFGVSTIG